jgi:hypothetical protein
VDWRCTWQVDKIPKSMPGGVLYAALRLCTTQWMDCRRVLRESAETSTSGCTSTVLHGLFWSLRLPEAERLSLTSKRTGPAELQHCFICHDFGSSNSSLSSSSYSESRFVDKGSSGKELQSRQSTEQPAREDSLQGTPLS